MRTALRRFGVVGVLVTVGVTGWATAATKDKKAGGSGFPLLQDHTINMMIDGVARSVARRYDLSPEQADVAREMLERNTWQFVNTHFETLAVIMPKMYELRTSKTAPSPEQIRVLAEQFQPLVKEAAEVILSENEKFAQILDDKQKKIHGKDLAQARKSIKRWHVMLDRWRQGKWKPGEWGPRKQRRRRAGPVKPPAEQPSYDPTSLDYWELYLKTFIEGYRLDQGQKTLAYSIFGQVRAKALAYKKDHRLEFRQIKDALKAKTAATSPADKDKRVELQTALAKLNQPLLDMFDEMTRKLMDIPTAEQVAEFEKTVTAAEGATTTQEIKPSKTATTQAGK